MKATAVVLCLTLAGCGTVQDLGGVGILDGPRPHVFGGTRVDAYYISGRDCHHPFGFVRVFDLPLSLALDVVLLPVSVPVALLHTPEETSK